MRLTLRTLLAYLDDTLEPQDAEVLRQKVEQSGFATQLIQRIRGSLADPSLSAPAPDSVHPIEEPNMMSNYLDSTLSPEQIAEIEKACLESLPHLAEAAACHQILTMVLGRPAEVSDSLRERVLTMVDEGGNIVAGEPGALDSSGKPAIAGEIGPRYSGVDLPGGENVSTEEPTAEALAGVAGDIPVQADSAAGTQRIVNPREQAPQAVKPVGVDDSGVFQAATKLREQSHQFADAGTALDGTDSLGGVPPKEVQPADLYTASSRAPKVTPWLISIALVAVLIFAIFQIFAPLLGPKVAQNAEDDQATVQQLDDEGGPSESAMEASKADDSTDEDGSARGDEPGGGEEASPSPAAEDAESTSVAEADQESPDPPSGETPAAEDVADASEEMNDDEAPPIPPGLETTPEEPEMTVEDSLGPPPPPGVPDERIAALPDKSGDAGPPSPIESPEMKETVEPTEEKAEPAGDAVAGEAIAKLVNENTFTAAKNEDASWTLLPKDADIQTGQVLVCAPEYRADLAFTGDNGSVVTLVGPTEAQVIAGEQTVNLKPRFGRGLVMLGEPGKSVGLTLGETTVVASTESINAVLAFELSFRRELGSDPLVPENHEAIITLTSVVGDFSVTGEQGAVDLAAGSQISQEVAAAFSGDVAAAVPDQMPIWVDPEVDSGSLEAEAASDLLELVRGDASGSLLLSLRVALGFRRNEVAALAGKTMLALGDASAYFGVDGLLSNPKQRLYWSSHLDAIREMMSRGVEESAAVRTAIAGQNATMDVVEGDTLFRLLTGYTQDQLKTGGDAELVNDLESRSLPVRVLAAEHLRDISGTTMFFKPEEEVASRREEVVKKWKVRLRKESIRYPEPE